MRSSRTSTVGLNRSLTAPSWWNKLHTTIPTRRKSRDLIKDMKDMIKTKHLDEIEAVIFPEGNKPQVYYW